MMSSASLAMLIAVPGREIGGPAIGPPDGEGPESAADGGICRLALRDIGGADPSEDGGRGGPMGPGPGAAPAGVEDRGGVDLGVDLGGGGVVVDEEFSAAPAALLIHFLSTGSK